MSRLPNHPAASSQAPRAARVAAVQTRPDGGLAILIAETGGPQPTIAAALSVDQAQAAESLKPHKVDLVIRLVPGAETVCRVLPVPDAIGQDRSQVADALGLLAESELPNSIPWYRRASGILRLGDRAAALLAGWVGSHSAATIAAPLSNVPEVWVPEIAALGSLGQALGGGPMIGLTDRAVGLISMLAFGSKRPVGRVLRLSADDAGWPRAVRSAWTETASAAGVDTPPLPSEPLLFEVPTSARLAGATRDAEWIRRHGLALGAVLLYTSGDAAVSSLVAMTPTEPSRALPFHERVLETLSRPRVAVAVAAASIAVLLFAPWVAAEARYSLLRAEAGDLSKLEERLSEAERLSEFYRLLNNKRWPMTKLLADIAGAAPVGVVVESVELAQGEAISLRATADSSELVTTFRKNLADTKVFQSVATPTIEATADGVSFQLQARLSPSGAMTASAPIDDFAKQTLAQRLYGDAAGNSAQADHGDEPADSRDDDRRTSERRASGRSDRESSDRGSSRTERSAASAPAAAPTIPPPLTDAEIAAMDAAAAMKEWGVRRKASTQPGLDAATRDRLAAEAEKCKARMQAARGGGA